MDLIICLFNFLIQAFNSISKLPPLPILLMFQLLLLFSMLLLQVFHCFIQGFGSLLNFLMNRFLLDDSFCVCFLPLFLHHVIVLLFLLSNNHRSVLCFFNNFLLLLKISIFSIFHFIFKLINFEVNNIIIFFKNLFRVKHSIVTLEEALFSTLEQPYSPIASLDRTKIVFWSGRT